jgi:hypothetical protein
VTSEPATDLRVAPQVPVWPEGRSLHGGVDRVPLPEQPGRLQTAGQLWLSGKRFVGPDPAHAMAEVGATCIVCLCELHELDERYPAYVEWLHRNLDPEGASALDSRIAAEAASGGISGGAALWFPVPDLHAPPVNAAVGFLGHLSDMVTSGETVLMHCGAGIGRAGTLAAGLLVWLGDDVATAKRHVAASRPMAGPEAGAQEELLIELEQVRSRRGH